MHHRIVGLLLVPVLFLQGMVINHSHGGRDTHEPLEHRGAPHFHGHFFGLVDHASDGDDDDDCVSGQDHEAVSALLGIQTAAHDDDAVYVIAPVTLRVRPESDRIVTSINLAANLTLGTAHLPLDSMAALLRRTHPPPLWCPTCPIYLQTQTLLV